MSECISNISSAVINVSAVGATLSPDGETIYYVASGGADQLLEAPWPSDPDNTSVYVNIGSTPNSIACRNNGDIYYLGQDFSANADWFRVPAGGGSETLVASNIGIDSFSSICYSYADDVFYAVEQVFDNDVYVITPAGVATQIISNVSAGRLFCTIDGALWWADFTDIIHRYTVGDGHQTYDPSDSVLLGGPCASPDTAIWGGQTGFSTKHVAKTTGGISYTSPFPGCDDPATFNLPNGTDYPVYDELYLVPGIYTNGGDGSDRWYTILCAAAQGRWGVNEVVMG